MEIELDTDKSAAQNASRLFDRAKKLEAKAKKAKEILKEMEEKLKKLEKSVGEIDDKEIIKQRKKRKWFENFKWFESSTGLLVLGGRDATSNEVLIKKHTKENETVLHAEITGAPFFVIKGEADEQTLAEAAIAAASFSRAWKMELGMMGVYAVKANQVSKQAQSGEYLTKGAFMIRGKKTKLGNQVLKLAIGKKDELVTAGPISAIQSWTNDYIMFEPGILKPGEITKLVVKELGADADDVQRALPAGKFKIIKKKKA
ncbi:MAG: DUF814 domain-containing protein [Candidatus Altiarchaeota archaeon]|nr:DUF814 domain-containing protein [Candidatus Altiarchaeota archaeon]